jgi:ribosome maturation factor RimP
VGEMGFRRILTRTRTRMRRTVSIMIRKDKKTTMRDCSRVMMIIKRTMKMMKRRIGYGRRLTRFATIKTELRRNERL